MNLILKTLYIYISNLGIVVSELFIAIFRALIKFPSKFFKFNKYSFSSAKTFFKRSVAFILVVAVIAVSVVYLNSSSNKTKAVALMIDGETIGYAQTRNDADHARALALNSLDFSGDGKISFEDVETDASNVKPAEILSESIVQRLAPDRIKVSEIYVDGEFLCAVKDRQAARKTFLSFLENSKKQYPNSVVSFAEEIAFAYAYYNEGDSSIWETKQLDLSLKTLGLLSIRHAECEKSLSTVEFETVDIQTNTLFVGDSRIRRVGKNGKEYAIDLVTYIGDKKVLSEHLMSVSVQKPVSQIIERGIRAESLSLGTYSVLQTTGYFCWPVVGLFTVTSPYGNRSLGYHRGIDISGANASGSLVVAGATGTVTEAGWSTGGYGNYVVIDHGNGVETLYAHMLDNSLMVSPGDIVTKGQAIGRVGNTGYSFGAHLHFEVRINGNKINPAPYLGLE